MRFAKKSVIVTGALGGIGRACARQLAREGASLVLVTDQLEAAGDVEKDLTRLGASGVILQQCDVANESEVVLACDVAQAGFGALDVVVNVAGVMIYKAIEDLTTEDWIRVFAINFMGAAFFTRESFRRMKPGGSIVNVSSIHAHMTSPLVAPYAAAKAALGSLTRTSAIEGKSKGIRANAVLPGAIDTPMLWSNPNLKSGAEVLAPDDIGSPENIAMAVAYLASSDSCFVTGVSLNVDGGRLARL